MRIWVWVIYKVGGKWAVLLTFAGLGLLVLLAAVLALFGKLDSDSDS